jgi:hypothetical protein
MKNLFNRLVYACAILLMVSPLVSCGSGGGGGTAGTTGTLSLGLTDAAGDYQHVFVTIKEIQVNKAAEEEGDGSGWITAMSPNETIDLKTLENGEIFDLGLAELEVGHYNQMRFILAEDRIAPHPFANYVVIEGEQEEDYIIGELGNYYTIEELKVPSGFQTGIKIVKGFEIVNQGTTALILDFDAKKSVVKAGESGKWLLKPTIKVLETVENSISGTVVDDDTGTPVPDATVSAQIFDSEAAKVKKEVIVESTTGTTAGGGYKLFLPPDVYNVVVTTDNFLTTCQVVEAFYYEEYLADFRLISRDTGTDITLNVVVSGLDVGESALLSIRQPNVDCVVNESETISATIEVASDHVENGSYSYILLAGTYNLIVYTLDETIETTGINSTDEIDVGFTPAP